MEKREVFNSRLGFLLVSAGCAIGIGNVWRFPYVAGENGGAIFVLFYLLFLAILGIPVMTLELAIGRGSGQSAVQAYKTLEKPGSKWHLHGWLCILGNYLLMMYYTTVAGWMVAYTWKFMTGKFNGAEDGAVAGVFSEMLADPKQMVFFMAVVVFFAFLVLSRGVKNGLESVSKFMMLGLLLLIVILAVHSILLPGASEGISFYLKPNLSAAMEIGLGNVIVAAMNQAFFTLSLGLASIEIMGSYMSRKRSLTGEAVRITALDTFVAIMAGFIIFPACFSYNVSPDQGPALIFITLPEVFLHMPAGQIWGSLFFLFMTFASFSTVIAVCENLVAFHVDTFGTSRIKSVWTNFFIVLIASLPCALSYNILSSVHLIGGRDILDSEDFIVSNILLPIGALVFVMFCVTRYGWGFEKYLKEVNTGEGLKMPVQIKPYLKYGMPILIAIIAINGFI